MALALFASRLALAAGLISLLFTRASPRPARPVLSRPRRYPAMALGTLALGLALFALFFGLVAACDRL